MKQNLLFVALAVLAIALWVWPIEATVDEAKALGLERSDFPSLQADVFEGMDQGTELTQSGIVGRNDWNLWTGGSQRFIDWLAREGHGVSDVLRMLDSRERDTRFERLGLINEPGFVSSTEPDEFGLYLDVPAGGAELGRIDRMIADEGIDERVYGRSTGVLGLRLFPNPDFDEEAEAYWMANRHEYYDEHSDFAVQRDLIRPYRVGMSCGVCHIAPNPMNPPPDPDAADWEHLSSAIGNQYFREGAVFASEVRPPSADGTSSFLWELLDKQPPGTSDTSRMATDHINNPSAINAIFNLGARLDVAEERPMHEVSAATMAIPGTLDRARHVPHVLKDGADSVGVPGATIRVYVNIGLFSERWLDLHRPLMGVRPQQPFDIGYAQTNSTYWGATEDRLGDIATFLASVGPMPLAEARWLDAEGNPHTGVEYITDDPAVLERGAVVFAENCARCHSSKRPPESVGRLTSGAARAWFRDSVLADDFRENNFLSEDARHPVSDVGTNAARAMATNATRGHIWDYFSSDSYKDQPAGATQLAVWDPRKDPSDPTYAEEDYVFDLEDSGDTQAVGYYRTPSLIGIWSSAPFLHNNMLGTYTGDPSVPSRVAAFEDAAEKLLWPERRLGVDSIWRTDHESYLEIPLAQLPAIVQRKLRAVDEEVVDTSLVSEPDGGIAYLRLGPIPAGTPISLLANLDLELRGIEDADKAVRLARLALGIKKTLLQAKAHPEWSQDELRAFMKQQLVEPLLENSNCPDFITDKGHAYGTQLPDADKRALIEFLKTL